MSLILHPLQIKDQFRAHQCMMSTALGGQTSLATWAFPPHYMWKDVLKYSWTEVNGWWCLFAEYADGLFMPLPPLGPSPGVGSPSSGSLQDVLAHVMTIMETRNKGSQVTRIENIPAELQEVIRPWGYSLTQNDSDYVYQTTDLVQMKANAYKSQRAAYNRFFRAHRIRVAPYRIVDRDGCLALFDRWVHQKEENAVPQIGPHGQITRVMLREAVSAHRVVLQEYRELGLTGRVVWVDGSIKAYAFGYPRSREVFCLLLEVADRSISGLAHYLFREFCREIQQYPFVNTMGDFGLPSVARTKHAYRPTQLVSNFIAQPML
jgi:hypothetical protein